MGRCFWSPPPGRSTRHRHISRANYDHNMGRKLLKFKPCTDVASNLLAIDLCHVLILRYQISSGSGDRDQTNVCREIRYQ